jgi:hypothetical protein
LVGIYPKKRVYLSGYLIHNLAWDINCSSEWITIVMQNIKLKILDKAPRGITNKIRAKGCNTQTKKLN